MLQSRAATITSLVVAVAFVAAVGSQVLAPPREVVHLGAAAVQLAGLLLLLARYRVPVLVLAGEVAVFAAVHRLLGSGQPPYPLLLVVVATYTVATLTSPRRAVSLSAVAVVAVLAAATGVHAPIDVPGPTAIQYLLLMTAVTAVGLNVRARRELLAGFRERARQAEREQRLIAAQAVTAERQRVARDLHDTVAHHVSLLVVQAGAVRESLPREHEMRGVLDSMIDGGRQAMDELRDMLSALRVDTDLAAGVPPSLRPEPGLEQIPDLVESVRRAGLPVQLTVHGDRPAALGHVTSLAAYRIVQEALTNVARHAPGAPATVTIRYTADVVDVTITNPVTPTFHPSLTGGHGLVGMRERAGLARGTLTAGPILGGYEVAAVLPCARTATATP